jgi:hypothetical protein
MFGQGKSGSKKKNTSSIKKTRQSHSPLKIKINQMSPFQRPDSANRHSLYSADGDRKEVILDHDQLMGFDEPPQVRRHDGRGHGSN